MRRFHRRTLNKSALCSMTVGLTMLLATSALLLQKHFETDVLEPPIAEIKPQFVAAVNAYDTIPDDEIWSIKANATPLPWYNEEYYLNDAAPIAALVRIDSIDGGRAFSEVTKDYMFPYTFGKMTVLEVYKGDVELGKQINYTRMGGIVTYDEYVESLSENERDKFLRNSGSEHPKYVEVKFDDGIDIEPGKLYVTFFEAQYNPDGGLEYYGLDPTNYGLREVQGYDSKARAASSDLRVLNNLTDEWETLDKLIRIEQ